VKDVGLLEVSFWVNLRKTREFKNIGVFDFPPRVPGHFVQVSRLEKSSFPERKRHALINQINPVILSKMSFISWQI